MKVKRAVFSPMLSLQIDLLWWIWMQDLEGVTKHIVIKLHFRRDVLGRYYSDIELWLPIYWLIVVLLMMIDMFFFLVKSCK